MQNATAVRKVEENTKALAGDDAANTDDAADNVGMPVGATDPDPNTDPLIYSLGGPDAGSFRVRDNGQIEVGAGTKLDHETQPTYMVTVMAEDSFGATASIDVTITVTDVDEMPDVSGMDMIDYAENGTGAVATYSAADPEGASVTWGLSGDDMAQFDISDSGVLNFKKSPNHEMPRGAAQANDNTNTYAVTVQATDETRKTGTHEVTVMVTNVGRGWTVALSARSPRVDVAFTATLTDPDGAASNDTWQWAKSQSRNGSYTDIEGAEGETYTPTDASGKSDIGYHLRATASYTDPQGMDKSAMMMSETQVQTARSSNNAPAFADDQDPLEDGNRLRPGGRWRRTPRRANPLAPRWRQPTRTATR